MSTHTAKRVLMLNSEHGWRGGENQTLLLAQGLVGDYQPLMFCQPDSPLATAARTAGLTVTEQRMRSSWDLAAIRAIRKIVTDNKIDLLHAHTSHAHSLAALAGFGRKLPLVVTRRVDFPLKKGFFSRWKYVSAVTRYAAVSQGVRQVMISGEVPAERIDVIWDGIDFARFPALNSTLRQEFSLPTHALVVGVTAHLTDHKDHATLLRAFAEVEKQLPHAYLFIVGSGELEAELKKLAAQLGLKNVIFTGFRSDINNILRALDVFALTSHLEGLGSSVMDAMYCGLPVVATRAGGLPELVRDGINGTLVAVRNHQEVAQALLRLLSDSDYRKKLGAAAQQHAQQRFAAQVMVAGYRRLYEQVLS